MNFKKLLATVAAASMLVACGGGDKPSSTGTELKDGDTVKIGLVRNNKMLSVEATLQEYKGE